MFPSIVKMAANTRGKDYVVGDLHGCYSLLMRLMAEAGFDRSRDRLFSVGDLVDRGPDPLRCLQLLFESWFFAVKGNHEDMMLDFLRPYFETGVPEDLEFAGDSDYFLCGGDWLANHYTPASDGLREEILPCLSKVAELPLVRVIGDGDARFHIIHAQLLQPGYRNMNVYLDQDLDAWLAAGSVPDEAVDQLLWERDLVSYARQFGNSPQSIAQPGLSRTFCGHTPIIEPLQISSHVFVDTGAYLGMKVKGDIGYSLTLFDVAASSWLSASFGSDETVTGTFSRGDGDRRARA